MTQMPDQPSEGLGLPPGSAQGPPADASYPPPPGGSVSGYTSGYPTTTPDGLPVYLDQASGLLLPQGTQMATVGRRIGAYFLAIPLSILTLGIGYLIWGLAVWGRGQTPALQVLGMRCYRPETGRAAGFGYMALREIIGRLVDGIVSIITYIVSFVLFASRSDHRSLHDLIAGTVVLHDPQKVLAKKS